MNLYKIEVTDVFKTFPWLQISQNVIHVHHYFELIIVISPATKSHYLMQ